MPLHFHMGLSKQDARRGQPSLTLDRKVHEAIFSAIDRKDFPRLATLKGSPLEARFLGPEIAGLASELGELASAKLGANTRNAVSKLSQTCDEALDSGLDIYVFRD